MNGTPYNLLLDILKYTVAGVGVVYIAFYLFKPYLDRSEKLLLIDLKKAVSSQTIPLRLQAYERLVLFIERVNPASLLLRMSTAAYTSRELQMLLLEDIRNEFQHNVTQQIYVSAQAWAVVKKVKDDTLNMINHAARSIPQEATGLDLGKTLLQYLSQLENDPYDMAAALIRQDLEQLF
jgi:hypothetical protein